MEQPNFWSTEQSYFRPSAGQIEIIELIRQQNELLDNSQRTLYTQNGANQHHEYRAKIIDLKMPLGSMIALILKWQLAVILAFLILILFILAVILLMNQIGLRLPPQLSGMLFKIIQGN